MRTGLADPVFDSQKIFRAVLDATSHPGRVVSVPLPVEPPAPLRPATASLCLALVDLDTPLWLDAEARTPEVIGYLRFHCGCPISDEPGAARFAVIADASRMPDLDVFDAGSDEYPDRSATVIVQVEALEARTGQRLTGPGIETETRVLVTALPEGFWPAVRRNHARFPRGVDVIFVARDTIVATPRSTRAVD